MRTYHTVDSDDTTIYNNPSTAATTVTSSGQVVNSWLYCVAEFEEVEADISITEHTIEEEYTAYVMSLPIRKQSLDPIKFWEVC